MATYLDGNEQDKLILASEEMKFDCFSQVVQAGSPLSCFYVALQGHFFKFDSQQTQPEKPIEKASQQEIENQEDNMEKNNNDDCEEQEEESVPGKCSHCIKVDTSFGKENIIGKKIEGPRLSQNNYNGIVLAKNIYVHKLLK